MKFAYPTRGTCSRNIILDVEDDRLVSVAFDGGCNGNLKGISSLCAGMKIDEVIEKLAGIKCGFKNTSCPDQLAEALKAYKAQQA